MRKLLFWILLSASCIAAQHMQIAWLSGTRISTKNWKENLTKSIADIKERSFDYIIHTGSITPNGKDKEFHFAKESLEKTGIKYKVLPGKYDMLFPESATFGYEDNFEDYNFIVHSEGIYLIGINSVLLYSPVPEIPVESLTWLENASSQIPDSAKIFLFTHFAPSDISNFGSALNLLKGKNLSAVFSAFKHFGDSESKYKFQTIYAFDNAIQPDTNYLYKAIRVDQNNVMISSIQIDGERLLATYKLEENIVSPDTVMSESENSVEILWEKELNSTMLAKPLVTNDKIITTEYNGTVQCFDLDGNKLWDYDAFGNIVSSPIAEDGYLIVATVQGDIQTLDINTGEQLQSIGFDNPITSGLASIEYSGDKELMIPKETDSKAAVIFADARGKVYCYDIETLQEYWSNDTPKDLIRSTPVILGEKVILGCWDGYLYCFDSREGWLIWKWRESKIKDEAPALSKPVTDGKFIYIVSPSGNTVKIDPMLGRTVKKSSKFKVNNSIGITSNGKRLLLKSVDGKFFDPFTKSLDGGLTYKINFGYDPSPTKIIEWNKIFLFPTSNGDIYRVKNRKYKTILNVGHIPLFDLDVVDEKTFFISSYNGKMILFTYDGN